MLAVMTKSRASIGPLLLLVGSAGACGDSGSASGDGGNGGGGPDLSAGAGPDMAFVPHAPWLGLPASAPSTTMHLRAGDVVYASDLTSQNAVTAKNAVAGARAAVLLYAGCCAPTDVPGYPGGVDAILYDYQPNQDAACPNDRCQSLPMYCEGGGGLPAACANEPTWRCTLAQHQRDFDLVHLSATKRGVSLWTAPAYYSAGTMGCPAAGMPVPVDWGQLASSTGAYFFHLDPTQGDMAATVAAATAALASVRAQSPATPVWAVLSLTYTVLCAKAATCTTGPPGGCDAPSEAAKLAPLVQALGGVRAGTPPDKQIEGVLLLTDQCAGGPDVIDKLAAAVRP
jgi:hypothetical protein